MDVLIQIKESSSVAELQDIARCVGLGAFDEMHVSLSLSTLLFHLEQSGEEALVGEEGHFAEALLHRGGELAHGWSAHTLTTVFKLSASLGVPPLLPALELMFSRAMALAGGLAPKEVAAFVGAVADLGVEVGRELMGALQGRVVTLSAEDPSRFNAQDVLGLLHAFGRMPVAVSPDLGESLQRQAMRSVARYPASAMPKLLRAVASLGAAPNWELLEKLQEAAAKAAHLFTAEEVLGMMETVATLGPTPLPSFVDAMQLRAVQACRDLAPGDILRLMSALAEMGEVPNGALVGAMEGRVVDSIERFGEGELSRLMAALEKMQVVTSPAFNAAVRPPQPPPHNPHASSPSPSGSVSPPAGSVGSRCSVGSWGSWGGGSGEGGGGGGEGGGSSTRVASAAVATPGTRPRDPRLRPGDPRGAPAGHVLGSDPRAGRMRGEARVWVEVGWGAPVALELEDKFRPWAVQDDFVATPEQLHAARYNSKRVPREFARAADIPPNPGELDADRPQRADAETPRIPASKAEWAAWTEAAALAWAEEQGEAAEPETAEGGGAMDDE